MNVKSAISSLAIGIFIGVLAILFGSLQLSPKIRAVPSNPEPPWQDYIYRLKPQESWGLTGHGEDWRFVEINSDGKEILLHLRKKVDFSR